MSRDRELTGDAGPSLSLNYVPVTAEPSGRERYSPVTLTSRHFLLDAEVFTGQFFDCSRRDVTIAKATEPGAAVVY